MKLKNIPIYDCYLKEDKFPLIYQDSSLKDALDEMDKFKLGVAIIIDKKMSLIGILTDGDIRRTLIKNQKPLSASLVDDVIKFCIENPKYINHDESLIDAINFMNKYQIWDLPVIKNDKVVGLLHMHSALEKLILNYE
ncbi:MAG: CBS domain-containing protein [Porticoccus sp.]|nr:CBS domain-containing protein [Porticoccus sp.]|tara:strand:- start:12 stop:425 length:414 start_codon:yes stop_codon:yes gene_type:complete